MLTARGVSPGDGELDVRLRKDRRRCLPRLIGSMATGRSTSSVNRTGRATSILSGRTRSRGGGSTSFSRSPWWARTTPEGIGLSSLNRRSANARDPRVRLADRPERDRGPSTGAERCSGHWRGEHIGRRDAPATRSFGSTPHHATRRPRTSHGRYPRGSARGTRLHRPVGYRCVRKSIR